MRDQSYRGSCLCGAVKYQVDRIEDKMAHCHCRMCRKFHGAAFATYGEARTENFHWLGGVESLGHYTAENKSVRTFCTICGSSLIFAAAGSEQLVEFALATLDDDINELPDVHVFVDYKANWYVINDNLPQHQEGRPDNEA